MPKFTGPPHDNNVRICPFIYEINTWIWLSELARKHGHAVQLGSIPAAEWDEVASWGFDAVWLMGVWERSPRGAQIAREHSGLQRAYSEALPDYTPADVVGSPYCIHRYVADAVLGGTAGLQIARRELAVRNIALILDFVPNHVAIDHPWIWEHPEYFIHGADGRIENGRDPYFPAWTDTAQINAFHAGAREALIGELKHIAVQCDGVRCDMAMLLLNDVFRKTWGEAAGTPLPLEFWAEAIPAIKAQLPDFTFLAEVYWDLEWSMLHLGFDYGYDKRLYDRLLYNHPDSIREHLRADIAYQSKLVRGIENHDEPRAAAVFSQDKEQAAMIAVCTVPGAKLFHEGQFEGRKVKLPVQLGRRPEEPVNTPLHDFYRTLLQACRDPLIRFGDWQLLSASGWPDNMSYTNLLAWSRCHGDERVLIVINYADTRSQGRVHLPWADMRGRPLTFRDVISSAQYVRDGDELAAFGLYVDLPAWGIHFLLG